MAYDPSIPLAFYERLADDEWTRLTRTRHGELVFHVHMDVLRRYVHSDQDVLELGAGAGMFSKELAHLARRLVVSDLSPVQLELNRRHMRELGLSDRIDDFRILDIVDLGAIAPGSFDTVVCVGGPLSYLLDRAADGLREMLRATKPGGLLVFGVLSLVHSVIRHMASLEAEKDSIGIDNMRRLLETGVQDERHPATEHYVHMMTARDVDALLAGESVDVPQACSA